jgi:hypothetical protein
MGVQERLMLPILSCLPFEGMPKALHSSTSVAPQRLVAQMQLITRIIDTLVIPDWADDARLSLNRSLSL